MSRTLIIGAGRSACAANKLLLAQGQATLVSDIEEKFPEIAAEIRASGVELRIGPQDANLLDGVSRIIVSPGLSPQILLLQQARKLSIPILSEIDLALASFHGQVIGVTGTNGKSTTTTLIAHILKELGHKAEASGNIGIPPSLLIAEKRSPEVFVLELSSYQLDFSQPIKNHCSLFMSFSPDHLERHGSLSEYFRAKWRLIEATNPNGVVILPRRILDFADRYSMPEVSAQILQILVDDEIGVLRKNSPHVRIDTKASLVSGFGFSEPVELPSGLSFHNQLNVVASALAVRSLYKTDWTQIIKAVSSYSWLPHRFQKIGNWRGMPVFNDSKSTNVESTLVALRSMTQPAILMVGGHPKGESFSPISDYQNKIARLVAFGAAGPQIAQDLSDLKPIVYPTLKLALADLTRILPDHPCPIVFSPACSSFDEFKNFEERGLFFENCLQPMLDKS